MAERHSDHPGTPPVAPAERRASARVPLDRPVRIGPPGGYPHASVTARDLSPGGLFIDAERDVRVGARFSVAIPLRSGHDAYIPEAEVVDNRSGTERGFGVRFVKLSAEARRALEDEVSDRAYVTLRTIPVSQEPHSFDDVDFPTMDPMPVPGPAF
ncbi:MAG: PilZ domain-containing protein, partial [Myxococcota bacterium]